MKALITENIQRHKRHLAWHMCTDPNFSFSIGNHIRGLPELIMLGNLPADIIMMTLNLVSEKQEAEGAKEGVLDIGFTLPVKVRFANNPFDLMTEAIEWLGTKDFRVMQVLIPDKQGKYADEEGCEAPYNVRLL